jgi:hypothetical protein
VTGCVLTESVPDERSVKDRRRVARFPFAAAAEITETAFGTRMQVYTSDLSLFGCYVRMTNPLPRGAQVIIRISTETDFFEAPATVAFSQPNLGIGLAFHDVNAHFLPTLKKWLAEAMQAITRANQKD